MADITTISWNDISKDIVDSKGGGLTGSGFKSGSLKGKSIDEIGSGWICDILRWISDNNDKIDVYGNIEFRPNGVFIGARVVDKLTNNTVKTFPAQPLDGHIFGISNVTEAVYQIGKRMAINVTKYMSQP